MRTGGAGRTISPGALRRRSSPLLQDDNHPPRAHGARLIRHEWVNAATQFNWALTQIEADTDWVLRLDADEYLTPALAAEIAARLPGIPHHIDGVHCGRRMAFQGRLIRHGGVFPVKVLRLFRHGRGRCEDRWMDEHVKVAGPTLEFAGELIDDNLRPLTWWTDKHNRYASYEALDLLNLRYHFIPTDSVASLRHGGEAALKRWVKEVIYARLPGGFRAFVYFVYRYVVRLCFLDGQAGTAFHLLQGFWYRYLVDAKVAEVERCMAASGCDVIQAMEEILGIRLDPPAMVRGDRDHAGDVALREPRPSARRIADGEDPGPPSPAGG